jgi:hypothetical protein
MLKMNLSDTVTIPAHVITRKVGEETVILNIATGTYFGLDTIGTTIWELMGQGKTLTEICDAMRAKYDVSQEDIEQDVIGIAVKLHEQQLISIL